MQGYVIERLTKDRKVKSIYTDSALVALRKFAQSVNSMESTGDYQVGFRDVRLTVSTLAVPNMPLPYWALVKTSPSGESQISFYCRELSDEERESILDQVKNITVLGGFSSAYFFNMKTIDIVNKFDRRYA